MVKSKRPTKNDQLSEDVDEIEDELEEVVNDNSLLGYVKKNKIVVIVIVLALIVLIAWFYYKKRGNKLAATTSNSTGLDSPALKQCGVNVTKSRISNGSDVYK